MKARFLLAFLSVPLVSLHAVDSPDPIAPILQSLVDKQLVTGVVASVVDKDKTLVLDTAGSESLKTKEPMRKDSLFWIASMTKTFTASALMMLVDEGKINVADPVEKYLPEFKGQLLAGDGKSPSHPPQRPITITDILTHTSGLVLASEKTLKKERNLAADVKHIAEAPLRREPGTKFEYNNCGIDTAGRIVEVVSGIPYAEFIQHRILDPLGMKDTTFWPTEEQAARLAHTAKRAEDKSLQEIAVDQGVPPAVIERLEHGVKVPAPMIADMGIGVVTDYANHYAMPAGGLYSTASDLGAYCQMLLNRGSYHGKRLLSEAAVKEMSSIHTGKVPVNPQDAWGLGWDVKIRNDEGPNVGSFGHRGARRTAMWIDPKSQIAMIILVERFDMNGEEQKEMYTSFEKAAEQAFGKPAQ